MRPSDDPSLHAFAFRVPPLLPFQALHVKFIPRPVPQRRLFRFEDGAPFGRCPYMELVDLLRGMVWGGLSAIRGFYICLITLSDGRRQRTLISQLVIPRSPLDSTRELVGDYRTNPLRLFQGIHAELIAPPSMDE